MPVNFRFPVRNTIKNKWFSFLREHGIASENVTEKSLVCSLHFDKCCFVTEKDGKLLLNDAVPSKIVIRIKFVSIFFQLIKRKQSNSIMDRLT